MSDNAGIQSKSEQINIPDTPHAGVREHFVRAVDFCNVGAQSPYPRSFRLFLSAAYSCQAIVELMFEEAKENFINLEQNHLKPMLKPLLPHFALIEKLRIHDFHRFGLAPPNPRAITQIGRGPIKLEVQPKGEAYFSVPLNGSPPKEFTKNARIKKQRPLLSINGAFHDEDLDEYVPFPKILQAFLRAVPAAVAEYEKLRIGGQCKSPDFSTWSWQEDEEQTSKHIGGAT
jgi:hypothetical protein